MPLEPIPFAGMVEIDLNVVIEELYGKNTENMPKYVVLGDGSLYIFHKEEDRYALCEQTTSIQERIPATESEGGTASTQCTGTCEICGGQNRCGQE